MTLTTPGVLDLTFGLGQNAGSDTVQMASHFAVSNANCALTSYILKTKQNDAFIAYAGSTASITAPGALTITTSSSIDETIYVEAATESGAMIRKQVRIFVCGNEAVSLTS